MSDEMREHALSFATVAEAYDRARPSYPPEAAEWLVGTSRSTVVELGAGTGKLTELLVAAGHDVIATDPLPQMLAHLRARVPRARAAVATAEHIPVASQSVDVVVCAQSFHWFDHATALPEIARVLRPGGVLALVWNARDEGIPWVRKLGAIIGSAENATDLSWPAAQSEHFGPVAHQEFRFWQSLRRPELFDLVRSRSYVALLEEQEREELLARVGALYDDYGRGPDGMQLPYLTRCYRAEVRHVVPPPPPSPGRVDWADLVDPDSTQPLVRVPHQAGPPEDSGTLLFDFR
ncbi:class I SAM-dependent methyltransferase [Nocardioides pocheonensis]|uniref:Class I SAM-dependent methyltransferase n=1 Tax=Nocardioides pocheonensis TaxID=661485 RepID=A0A3N0GRA2_9ACTN|nr:class I SAM-dependent methyltransferase [Nocardioides pocheonensis]RNM14672.1 class I SAM-dependent methyltransferase [Nocardioides pocheonensis]